MEEEKGCDVCSEKFSDNFSLKEHKKIHVNSEEKPFACEICCKRYSRKDHLQRHWRKAHPKIESIDDSNKYSKIYSRISNLNNNSGEKPFTCEVCFMGFTRKDHVKRHLKRIHPEIKTIHDSNKNTKKSFPCEICCKRFSQKAHLKRHQKRIHPEIETINESNKYSKIYSKVSNRNINSGEKPTCEICAKTFSRKDHLRRHLKRIHPEMEMIQDLNKNSQLCSKVSNLNIDSEEEPVACEIYCEGFSQEDTLKRHQKKIHSEIETINESNKYSKIYSSISELKKFLNISVDTKSFTCEVCLKVFSQKYDLLKHQDIHTKEKKFTCEKCYKQFSRSDHLKRHEFTHKKIKTEENSQISEEDSKDFFEIIDLYFPPEFYICQICSEKFSRSLALKRHQSTHATDKLQL